MSYPSGAANPPTTDLADALARAEAWYGFSGLSGRVASLQAERDRMREALERIASFESRYGPSDEAQIAREALDLKEEA